MASGSPRLSPAAAYPFHEHVGLSAPLLVVNDVLDGVFHALAAHGDWWQLVAVQVGGRAQVLDVDAAVHLRSAREIYVVHVG